ncbi:MAG: hypothetical protein LQ339_006610 [Xanthoria mediterranea]|nr:MAG: hypothetical protein LQ339_006610 [Xanthoria mediterranea]
MHNLLSLPNKLTTQVIDELDLTDTWSFARTSKEIYNLSQSAMQRHREYKEKYSIIGLGLPVWDDDGNDDGTTFDEGHPLFFIEQILRDPRITCYVTDLRLSRCGTEPQKRLFRGKAFGKQRERLATIITAVGTELAALGANCPWLNESRRLHWQEALLAHPNQAHYAALLLTLLPNLRSMAMKGMCYDCEPISELVEAIGRANRDRSSAVYESALSKLRSISIDHWENEFGQDITVYTPFVPLPSLRLLHGRRICGEFYPDEAPSALVDGDIRPIRQSQVEEIKITCSSVGSKAWRSLLKPIKNLKKFTYEHVGAVVGLAYYDCLAIMAILRENACHSLEHLDLTCMLEHYDGEQYVGDLKAFYNLRVLRLHAAAFCSYDEDEETTDREYLRLADLLPASIEAVTLIGWFDRDGAIDFRGEVAEERDKLPKLKRICLEGDWNDPMDHIGSCNSVGIEIIEYELAFRHPYY